MINNKKLTLIIGSVLTVFVLFVSCSTKSTVDKSATKENNPSEQVVMDIFTNPRHQLTGNF